MAIKTNLDKKKLAEIRHYAKLLKSAGIVYEKLLLFGSHVKGTARPWSDLDLCVVSKSFGKNRHSERVKLMKLKDDQSLDIEPHPYSLADLDNYWDPLAHEIKKYGVPV